MEPGTPALPAARTGPTRRVAIWAIAFAIIVAYATISLVALDAVEWIIALAPGICSLALVGALLTDHAPTNRIGPLLSAASVLLVVSAALNAYSRSGAVRENGLGTLPGTELADQVGSLAGEFAILIVLIGIPLIFPTGHLLSRRWRLVVWLAIFAMTLDTINTIVPSAAVGITPFGSLAALTAPVGFGAAMAAVGVRYRRGAQVERQQLKWLLATAGFATIVFPVSFLLPPGPTSDLAFFLGLFALAALPVAIGIAILRYRLYQIDRIVSRTLSYAVISIVLVGIYAAIVVALQAVLGEVVDDSPLAVAASTLVVASLFQPVRRRIQRTVDRRFDRRRYDAERTAAAFSDRLRDQMELESVGADLAAVIASSLRPRTQGLWIRTARRSDR